jgi:ferredoxin
MNAHVDKDTCIGCGLCPSISPEVFEMQDDGKAGEIVDSVPETAQDSAKEAAESCPVNAILVEE